MYSGEVNKIEGMLREMLRFMEIPTFVNKTDNKGRPITQERLLDDMLRDENLKSLIGEDDLFFFKYLLVEKEGLNLRHNVAHCLWTYEHYSISYAHLLIVALLRLSKYELNDVVFEQPTDNITQQKNFPS